MKKMNTYLNEFSEILGNAMKPVKNPKISLSTDEQNLEKTSIQQKKTRSLLKQNQEEHSKILEDLSTVEKQNTLTNLTVLLKVISLDLKESQAVVQAFNAQEFPWLSQIKFIIPECPSHILHQLGEFKVFIFSNITRKFILFCFLIF